MTTINNTNRTGIYVQESAGVTTAGDGMASRRREAMSPVTHKRNIDLKSNDDDQRKSKRKYDEIDQYTTFLGPVHTHKFISPAIKAGATEADSPYSSELRSLKRNAAEKAKRRGGDTYADVRRRMNLNGHHTERRRSPNYRVDPKKLKDAVPGEKYSRIPHEYRRKLNSGLKELAKSRCPIKVFMIDKSNIFQEIHVEKQELLINALETLLQDEYVKKHSTINVGLLEYYRKILKIRCENEETVKFLEDKISLLNRLWGSADLQIVREIQFHKRYKVYIRIQNYKMISDEVLKVIGKQNNLPTKYWSVFYVKEEYPGFSAIIGVDEKSYEKLQESDGYVFFFFDQLKLDLGNYVLLDR